MSGEELNHLDMRRMSTRLEKAKPFALRLDPLPTQSLLFNQIC